ncbi:MAG: uroporphyrinogen decarboxylase [Rickettsiales bacterium]|nr:uroporphyrinogen decarboxylase [Rickettsiales bacterium]
MKKLNNVLLKKEKYKNPPIWIMRQAGRYLPEYREVRSNVKNFLELCYNPKLASEVTLQPIRRFDFDAAIIFSDILVIPDALGIKVEFVKNEGPKLEALNSESNLKNLKINNIENHLNPVFEALNIVKSKLPKEKSLIGFSGSPWTLATYICEGGGSKNFDVVKELAIRDENFFGELIEILTNSIITYLLAQIKAGVDVVKLFDSWAGVLPEKEYQKWVINPNKKIIAAIRAKHPEIPVISFPRGSGALYENFVRQCAPNAIAIDQNCPIDWAKKNLSENLGVVLQGNLDNYLLAFGSKEEIEKEVLRILETFKDENFIFNLGHGILPETPIENVEFVMKLIK